MSNNKMVLSTENLINCAIYALIGLLLVIFRAGVLGILMTIIGVLFIVSGIMDIVKTKDTVKGVISIAIGAVIIVCGWLIAEIVLLIFGILLVIKGVSEIIKVYKNGFMAMLPSIVTIVIGALLIIAKFALIDVMCIIAGVIFIVNAVLMLFGKKLA
ncbi:MAG: DUF308 domain-containing protein [Clostridia bacterium]|nr:DUF308 domain-containing protein [Clostridia bacterium]